MKGLLKLLPFLIAFLLIFVMQTQLDVTNFNQPYLTPYGRATAVGTTTANRAPEVFDGHHYAWLQNQDLVIATVDPGAQQVTTEHRAVPDSDLLNQTDFQWVGNDLFWIGDQQTLKRATWQNGKWSQTMVIAPGTDAFTVVQAGADEFLLTGAGKKLSVLRVLPNGVQVLRTFPIHQLLSVSASVDSAGNLRIGAVDEVSDEGYALLYLTLDGKTEQVSDLQKVDTLFTASSTIIYDCTFATDQKYGYYLLTYSSKGKKSLWLYAMPLNTLKGKEVPMQLGLGQYLAYSPYVSRTQGGASVRFIYAGITQKNQRVSGVEAFLSTLSDGRWQRDLQPVSNEHGTVENPVFDTSQGETTVLFTSFSDVGTYSVAYNSNNPAYAKATNRLTSDDYQQAMMRVPQYLGVSFVLIFFGFFWLILPYLYLFFWVWKKEDALYDQPDRHFFVALVLYFLSQGIVFEISGKMANFPIYAPAWLQFTGAQVLILVIVLLPSYLLYLPYRKLRRERYALSEFTYFVGLNAWMVFLTMSYFVAP